MTERPDDQPVVLGLRLPPVERLVNLAEHAITVDSLTTSFSRGGRRTGPIYGHFRARRSAGADSARRRQRVIATLNRAVSAGQEISVSGIARAAGVDPHLPLPPPRPARANPRPRDSATGHQRHRAGRHQASLQGDLLAAQERTLRLAARVQQLERRLSEALGEQAWRESGIGAPADIDALNHKLTHLEQQAIDLRLQLDDRDQDLAAARVANRVLISQLNATAHRS